MHNFLNQFVDTRDVGTKGYGSFARHDIGRGTIIATFGGHVANGADLAKYPEERRRRSMQVDVDLYLVGPVSREPGDCINHSCAPNCGMRNATQLVTMCDVPEGSELTFDYAMSDTGDYDEFVCSCSTTWCRGLIGGSDWLLEDVRQRYVGYFSPYIQRLIHSSQNSRLLSKRDVEKMLAKVDESPVAAVMEALRIVIGFPFASWETAIAMYCNDDSRRSRLHNLETPAIDELIAELNETRGTTYRDFGTPSGTQLRTTSAHPEPSKSPR